MDYPHLGLASGKLEMKFHLLRGELQCSMLAALADRRAYFIVLEIQSEKYQTEFPLAMVNLTISETIDACTITFSCIIICLGHMKGISLNNEYYGK